MELDRISEDIRNFAYDLYDYIWTKHTFASPVLERQFADKLDSLIVEKKEKISNFTENIGEASLSSQWLLRSFCHYCFTQIGKEFANNHTFFNISVYNVIFNWTSHRSDIFCKVVDSAAIIAEAILFCDAVLGVAWEINEAPEMLTNFFETHLRDEFFLKGGWKQLDKHANECYSFLYIILEPFRSCNFYHGLEYDCDLIGMLRHSYVMFPVECLFFCKKCTVLPSEVIQNLFFDTSLLLKLSKFPIDDCSSPNEVWQNIGMVSLESNFRNLYARKENAVASNFKCRFLGGPEISKQQPKNSRKKRRRWSKNISKTNLDDEQVNQEVDNLQYANTNQEQLFLQSEESRTGNGVQNSLEGKIDCL